MSATLRPKAETLGCMNNKPGGSWGPLGPGGIKPSGCPRGASSGGPVGPPLGL